MKYHPARPIITDFANRECKSLYSQSHKLKIWKNRLYREYIDSQDQIWYKYVVPSNKRESLIKSFQDPPTCGHLAFKKTRDRMTIKFYWYNMERSIDNYVKSCIQCQTNKVTKKYNIETMTPIVTTRPNEIICTDVMGPIPETTNGYKHILVISDHFTKYSEFFPMKTLKL
jgi:putative transposase